MMDSPMNYKPVPLARLSVQGYKGLVREDLKGIFTDELLKDIEAVVWRAGGRIIKDSRVRWAAFFPAPGDKAFFIKKFKIKNWKERLKYLLLPSRAMKEWDVSLALRQRGIEIPNPVGVMEKTRWGFLEECLYISEAMEDTQPLIDFFVERYGERLLKVNGEKRNLITTLGRTLRRLHDGGIFQTDMHAGNFLIDKRGGGALHLIDLHRARIRKSLSHRQRLWNIAQLFYSLNSVLDQGDKGIFLEAYGERVGSFSSLQTLLMRIEGVVDDIRKRHQKSRAKRCLGESTLFTSHRWKAYRLYRSRDVIKETLLEIIDAHRETVKTHPSRLLKNSPKTIVSVVDIPNESGLRACVKHYRYPTAWGQIKDCFRYSKGKISWVASNELLRRGISHLKPLAYIEKRRFGLLRESFFITESSPDYLEMDRYLIKSFGNGKSRASVTKKRAFIQEFAQCIGRLHRSEIFHSDLKTCNILTRERSGYWDFSFIDLDAVRLGTKVDSRRALKNLVQINCSIPGFLGYGDRVRFLKWYLRTYPIPLQKRDLINTILEESEKRGVVYVSPEGDVIEEVLRK
jgi:tRNA A-37 threonylcarbamoyl transferase component Bud32